MQIKFNVNFLKLKWHPNVAFCKWRTKNKTY